MDELPTIPFLTKDFTPKGGGIDYLGLRWVNLKMLAELLLPDINNVTADIGTYFIGTWIPWKFQRLCTNSPERFTTKNYLLFREAIEVLMSYVMRDDSPGFLQFGRVRTRIGVEQDFTPGMPLNFKAVSRSKDNTLFAAALYGPSLNHLAFLAGYALSERGTATMIHYAADDSNTETIVKAVDQALNDSANCPAWENLDFSGLENNTFKKDFEISGLNPSFYRTASKTIKESFAKKLLPPGNPRTLTAKLIVATLSQIGNLSSKEMRLVWHTGQDCNGDIHLKLETEVEKKRLIWSSFEARQIQRYILETFLCCFERSVLALGGGDLESNVHWLLYELEDASATELLPTFRGIVENEIKQVFGYTIESYQDASKKWCDVVHANHSQYDFIAFADTNDDFKNGLHSMARWWIRSTVTILDVSQEDINSMGGTSRISAKTLYGWIKNRLDLPLETFCKELLSGLIFAQHLRIALSRLDDQAQKLRFTLGDEGIVPTPNVSNFGTSVPPRMADRLDAFLGLLEDLDIVRKNENNTYAAGENALAFWDK